MTDVRAGRGRRLAATLADAILVPSLTLLLIMVTDVLEDADDYQDYWWVLQVLMLAVVSYLVLNGYGLWKRGQTLGKQLLGIAIVSADLKTPAPLWKLIVLRAPFFPLLFTILFPWITLIPLLDQLFIFSRQRRCIHDHVAGTAVVRKSAPELTL